MKRGVLLTLIGLGGLTVGLEFLESHGHSSHGFPGFMLVFACAAALGLGVFAKLILFHLIGRDAAYWEDQA
jgi:hypothetical protein